MSARDEGRPGTGQAPNLDAGTVAGFGQEWSSFDQSRLPAAELDELFGRYFAIFPWDELPDDAQGFDLGCGSGRWAARVAPRVGGLHCIDPSPAAIAVAGRNLAGNPNCVLHIAGVGEIPLEPESMDFGYSLGVLHHVPDTAAGLRACVERLRPGAPFLIYLYYALEQRPAWFRGIWRATDLARRGISRLPHRPRRWLTTSIAVLVYLPLARLAALLERLGADVEGMPLSAYRQTSLYTMRTDALDRFGTGLEQRFSAQVIEAMMDASGLERIAFSPDPPYWCAVGFRRAADAG